MCGTASLYLPCRLPAPAFCSSVPHLLPHLQISLGETHHLYMLFWLLRKTRQRKDAALMRSDAPLLILSSHFLPSAAPSAGTSAMSASCLCWKSLQRSAPVRHLQHALHSTKLLIAWRMMLQLAPWLQQTCLPKPLESKAVSWTSTSCSLEASCLRMNCGLDRKMYSLPP
jgi:hypothetical protein